MRKIELSDKRNGMCFLVVIWGGRVDTIGLRAELSGSCGDELSVFIEVGLCRSFRRVGMGWWG